jgi:hypothetical protein
MFTLAGFVPSQFSDVEILVAQNLRLDAKLKTAIPATTVQLDLNEFASRMDTQSSSAIVHIPEDEFNRLPKGRSFQQLAILAPGVQTGEIEGGIQIHGASGAENQYLIDGVATQSAIDGKSRQNAVFDFVQEIQVQTTGVEANYSGALGGVISAVTRSGGNQFHGAVQVYYAGSSLSASPSPRLVLNPSDNRTVSAVQDTKNSFRSIEPGFSLGGPILKDKVYFFTAWSPQWTQQDQQYHFNNGSENGTIRRNQRFISGFNKVSFEPKPRLRSSFTWLWSPADSKGSLPVYNASCPNCLVSTAAANEVNKQRGFFNPQSGYGLNVDFPLGSFVVVSSRGNYFWDNYKDIGIPNITSVQYQTPALGPLVPAEFQGGVGFENTPAVLKYDHDLIARATGQFDVSIFAKFLGTHNLKTGLGVEKTVNNVNAFYPGGYVNVWWDRSFTSPVTGVTDRGTYGYYEANDFRRLGSTGAITKSFYVQDNWHVLSRLTLNFGVRMEDERVPSFRTDIQPYAIDFGWSNKVAPRIGAAFDFFGDGRLKLSGSWGRYFDPTRYELARPVFGGESRRA